MCLIAYSPSGAPLSNGVLKSAYGTNPDGIGVMSRAGVKHFVGKRALRKARRYLRTEVEGRAFPFAVHFRYATHGAVALENTHPFPMPNGGGYLMHNGVIGWCGFDKDKSDTRVFVEMLTDYPGTFDDAYAQELSDMIGRGNKLCIMNADETFTLVNAGEGDWIAGIWYSNTYSLPRSMGGFDPVIWTSDDEDRDPLAYGEPEFLPADDLDEDDYAAVLVASAREQESWYLDDYTYSPMQENETIKSMRDYYRSLERAARVIN